jgi:hypothetical protein
MQRDLAQRALLDEGLVQTLGLDGVNQCLLGVW